ncbi:putative vacuolar protein sorting vps16, partial [Operophtera brumata]
MMCLYGTKGNSTSFPYDGPFHLVQEMDCVRVVSELSHELVQKVPFVVEKIFRINSAAAGSFLLEASKQYQKRSHRADEYIRMVRPDLPTAVQDCLEAATFEFSVKRSHRADEYIRMVRPDLPTAVQDCLEAATFEFSVKRSHRADEYIRMVRPDLPTAVQDCLEAATFEFSVKRSHRADEYIRMVRPDLPTAVQDCLEAAAFEFSPPVQRALVRAAQFGKGFLADPELTDLYVRTCRWLRRVLLDRLIWRRLHCLATHIAQYLQLKDGRTRVLSHWACYKVSQPHLDNESAAREIGEKLRNVPGI